jgi:hypothetical protein
MYAYCFDLTVFRKDLAPTENLPSDVLHQLISMRNALYCLPILSYLFLGNMLSISAVALYFSE